MSESPSSLALADWLDGFLSRRGAAISLGLDRVYAVAARLGFLARPEGISLPCPVVVVGGTAQKGWEAVQMLAGDQRVTVACNTQDPVKQ